MTHNQYRQEKTGATHAEIALLAFTISQSQQGRHRSPEENWLEAERILKSKRQEALPKLQADPSAVKIKTIRSAMENR